MGCPYLGQQYIASSLLAAGHEVRALDMAAVRWSGSDDDAVALAEDMQPDMIGMTLFTYNALRGYQLASKLRHTTRLLVAGGAHPTVCPEEPLEHGFDVVVEGEGELAIRSLARWLDHETPFDGEPGIRMRGAQGVPRAFIEDLDALAFPLDSYDCYDAAWYSEHGMTVPGGMMTSRGCPARCTFCANYVTGRTYRFRSADNIIEEMLALNERYGIRHFPFWDDAFTARRSRLNGLCDAILAHRDLRGVTWTCITPGNMVKPHDLERMRKAGCVAVNFGIESGDYNILRVIQKGQRPEQVLAAVKAAKDAGMITIVNFMFGFPEEGVDELKRTLDFMGQLSEHTNYFNNRGVLVPFPGTAIYDQRHEEYGLTGWWLDPAKIVDEPNIHVLEPARVQAYLETDPTLELDFFRYSDAVRDTIAECVRFKAQHNQSTIEKLQRGGLPTSLGTRGSSAELQQKAAANLG